MEARYQLRQSPVRGALRGLNPAARTPEDYQALRGVTKSSLGRRTGRGRRTRPRASSRRRGGAAARPTRSSRGCRTCASARTGGSSRRHIPARPASPCVVTTTVASSAAASAISVRASATRSPTSLTVSPVAERRTSSPRRRAAYASGSDSPTSAPRRPSHEPTWISRSRLSSRAGSPVTAVSAAAVSRVRSRSLAQRALGSQRGEHGGGLARLRPARRVQRDVRLPLEAGRDVPVGLTVPPQDETVGRHRRMSSPSVIGGVSCQSRSSA